MAIYFDSRVIQQAAIELAKNTAAIADRVTHDGVVDIREESWRGKTFGYPCIRVQLRRFTPQNGSCRENLYAVEYFYQVISTSTSSDEVQEIVALCVQNLGRKKLPESVGGFVNATPLDVVQVEPRIPPPEDATINGWWGQVHLSNQIKFVSS